MEFLKLLRNFTLHASNPDPTRPGQHSAVSAFYAHCMLNVLTGSLVPDSRAAL